MADLAGESGGRALMYVRFGKRVLRHRHRAGRAALRAAHHRGAGAPYQAAKTSGPVFYNAPRVGKDGVDFKMYKLRSMRVNAPDLIMEDGSTYNGADDPRMTKIGAFMRKTSLDEMPQFFNVLLGDMSRGGPPPRPASGNRALRGRRGPEAVGEAGHHRVRRRVRPQLPAPGSSACRWTCTTSST